jgi:hypothetical protein
VFNFIKQEMDNNQLLNGCVTLQEINAVALVLVLEKRVPNCKQGESYVHVL